MNLNISHDNESWFTVSKCNEGCKGQFQIKNPVGQNLKKMRIVAFEGLRELLQFMIFNF